MVELRTYADEELPPELKCQVVSFQRIQWPKGFVGVNRLRVWIHHPEQHPTHFVLVEDGVLISYAGVLWKELEHAGEVYKTYGLSGVLTYPAFGRQGYGSRVVAAATNHIRGTDADVGLSTPHGLLFGQWVGSHGGRSATQRSQDRTVPERGTRDDGFLF